MAVFAITGKAEATRGAGCCSWTKEMRKRPCRFDGHKTDRRSGALCRTAGMAYDPRIWSLQLDNKKCGSDRVDSTGIRQIGEAALFAAQPEWLMTLEYGRCSWTSKSGSGQKFKHHSETNHKKARWLFGHRAGHFTIRISAERCSWCMCCSRPFLRLSLFGKLGMYRLLLNRW